MRKFIVTIACFVAMIGLGGCSAGACYICDSEEDTAAYTYLVTETKEALCAECLAKALGDPDQCAFCGEDADGFYVNLVEAPVFACQDCYDGLS